MTSASRRQKVRLVLVAMLVIAAGEAWAASQELPPPSDLPPGTEWLIPQQIPAPAALPQAEASRGWQGFLAYREVLRWAGGVIQALILLLVLAHLVIYGYHHVRPTGRMIRRYNLKEVILHALLALSFVGAWASSTYLILAKHVLGYADRSLAVPLGRVSNTVHITAGLLFFGALLALGIIWWRSMLFARHDREWLRALGGYFSRRHRILPGGHFNAGQKIWFYFSLILGVVVTASGALIYYPGVIGLRWDIVLYIVHTVLAVALSAAVIVHVYVAVLVRPQSAGSMITGKVDEACLREDHPLEPLPTRTQSSS